MRNSYTFVVEAADSRQPTADSVLLSAVSCELLAAAGSR